MKYKIGDKVTLTDGNIMTIDQIDDISKWYRMSEDPWNCYTDEMIEGLANPIEIDAKTFSEGYDQGYEDAFNDIVSYLRNHLYTPEFKDKNRFPPCIVSAENISLDELIDNLQKYLLKE